MADELLKARAQILELRAELRAHRALLLAIARVLPNRDVLLSAMGEQWEIMMRELLVDPSASTPAYFDSHVAFERSLREVVGSWAVGTAPPAFRPDD